MDPENKPNMKGTRIGGGYMVVRYVDSNWWWTGGCICGLGLVVVYGDGICGLGLVVVYGSGDVYGGVVV